MNNTRKLQDIVMLDRHWGSVTEGMFNQSIDEIELADHHGLLIADAVILKRLTVAEVRERANHYNILDREAVEKADGDIENYLEVGNIGDYIEASGRRLVYHVYHWAYRRVRSDAGRFTHAARRRQRI